MFHNKPITHKKNLGLDIVEEARKELISKICFMPINQIYPHEQILVERSSSMLNYISSLHPWTVLPSILICEKTFVIIDGHHRYYVLKNLGYKNVPVSYVKYKSDKIITHDIQDKMLEKDKIVELGLKNKLLKPKSTMHHCMYDQHIFPVILLSDLRAIKYE